MLKTRHVSVTIKPCLSFPSAHNYKSEGWILEEFTALGFLAMAAEGKWLLVDMLKDPSSTCCCRSCNQSAWQCRKLYNLSHATGLDAAEIAAERWACNDVSSCHLSIGVLDGCMSGDNEALCN